MREGGTTRILEETVKFLRDFSWIFNFKVTNALSDNIVDNIPGHPVVDLYLLDV